MGNESGDVDVEAQFYDELAGAFESLGARYRDAACVLRAARAAVGPGELDDLRRELAGVTRRVLAATSIGRVLLEPEKGGVK